MLAGLLRVSLCSVVLAVNVSMNDLASLDFPDTVAALAESIGIEPSAITLEVTERLAAHVGELARARRDAALRATGARGLGNREDGASLRAPGCRSLGGLRQQHGQSWHNLAQRSDFKKIARSQVREK